MSMVSLPSGEVSDLRAAVKERDALRRELVRARATLEAIALWSHDKQVKDTADEACQSIDGILHGRDGDSIP